MSLSEIYTFASSQIDACRSELHSLNRFIYENPELRHEEFKAHDKLTAFLEEEGFTVTRRAHGLQTAFRAELSVAGGGSRRNVAFNAEYDALPGFNTHACGHNLIATTAIASGLAVARALKRFSIPGVVTVFGTPAEEGGGGKITMIENGAYKNIDACIMAHPCNYSQIYLSSIAGLTNVDVTFHGRKAHAGVAPWDGINSLDAITLMWQAVGLLRQQLMPGDRISGVIVEGGAANNICPDYSKGSFGLRAETAKRLGEIREKFSHCVEGAATCTGCTYMIDANGWPYADMQTNDTIADRYAEHMVQLGRPLSDSKEDQKRKLLGGGTDQGNVSYEVPSIHPVFDIGCAEGCHTNEFYVAAGTEYAFEECLVSAKGMAFSAIDILMDDKVYGKMVKEFGGLKKRVGDLYQSTGESC